MSKTDTDRRNKAFATALLPTCDPSWILADDVFVLRQLRGVKQEEVSQERTEDKQGLLTRTGSGRSYAVAGAIKGGYAPCQPPELFKKRLHAVN